jgi:hypothetical protein
MVMDVSTFFFFFSKKDPKCKTEWQVTVRFLIHLHSKDCALLHCIKSYFGVGTVYLNERDKYVKYSVSSLKDITNVIIPHFNMYPLLSQKRADFESLRLKIRGWFN